MKGERSREFGYTAVGLSRFARRRVVIKGKVICLCGDELFQSTARCVAESPSVLHACRAGLAFLVPDAGDMLQTGQKQRFEASVLARQFPEELRPTDHKDLGKEVALVCS